MSKAPICDYCWNQSALASSSVVYGGRDFGPIYLCLCQPDLAYVGCHKWTTRPLGRLANGELREWKKRAHAAFDLIWKPGSDVLLMNRSQAYSWLAMKLGIDKSECHIGMFDVDMCKRVVDICGIRILEELGE